MFSYVFQGLFGCPQILLPLDGFLEGRECLNKNSLASHVLPRGLIVQIRSSKNHQKPDMFVPGSPKARPFAHLPPHSKPAAHFVQKFQVCWARQRPRVGRQEKSPCLNGPKDGPTDQVNNAATAVERTSQLLRCLT